MELQTWLILGGLVLTGIILLNTAFRWLGSLVRWGITIALLVFLFGYGAVAAVPGKIFDAVTSIGKQSVDIKINGQDFKCTIIPTVDEGNKIVTNLKPALDSITGPFGKDVTITVTESTTYPGKAVLSVRSSSIETMNKLKDSVQKLVPNIPVVTEQQTV